MDVKDYSQKLGFSRRTLWNRLIDYEYDQDENGIWAYFGNPENEPLHIDITQKKKLYRNTNNKISANQNNSHQIINENNDFNLITAIMKMPQTESVTRAYKTDKEIDARFKQIASETRLQINLLHSLALYEFVCKYEKIISKMKL